MLAPNVRFHAVTDIGGLIKDVLTTFGNDLDVKFNVTTGSGSRSEQTNALIAVVQAENGRNPFYLNQQQSAVVVGQVAKIATGKGFNWRTVSDSILTFIKQNAAAQISASGYPFKPLTAAYAQRKKRQFGFVTPILRATGDLLGGLRVRVDRRNTSRKG